MACMLAFFPLGEAFMPPLGLDLERQREWWVPGLVVEQPALTRESAGIAGQRRVGADDAMTRHHDGDRIQRIRVADGARVGSAHLRRELTVAPGLAVRNRPQRIPDPALVGGPARTDGQRVDGSEIAAEIAFQQSGGAKWIRAADELVGAEVPG